MAIAQRASAHPFRSSAPLDRNDPRLNPRDSNWRLVLLRAIVWGLVGLIYAPLFIGLLSLFERLGGGPWSFAAAAAVAGGAGAVLYGARETGFVGTGIGLVVGAALLVAAGDRVTFEFAVFVAAAVAALIVLTPAFPARCDRHVLGKALAGATVGAFGGAVLAIAEPLHPHSFPVFAVLAFLVSVNGVLYVASVQRVVSLTRRLCFESRKCNLIEALVVSVLAGIAAGSVWVMAGPFYGDPGSFVRDVGEAIYIQLPAAMLGGIFGGVVAGALLQAFGFSWVQDV